MIVNNLNEYIPIYVMKRHICIVLEAWRQFLFGCWFKSEKIRKNPLARTETG